MIGTRHGGWGISGLALTVCPSYKTVGRPAGGSGGGRFARPVLLRRHRGQTVATPEVVSDVSRRRFDTDRARSRGVLRGPLVSEAIRFPLATTQLTPQRTHRSLLVFSALPRRDH